MTELYLPKRVLRVIDRLRHGEMLVKTLVHGRDGQDMTAFHYHPSNRSAPIVSSQDAIKSGLLVANPDNLLGDGNAQTWRAK